MFFVNWLLNGRRHMPAKPSSISGLADEHGRATDDAGIAEFVEEIGLTHANSSYQKTWFKPTTTPRYDLFESY